MNGKTAMIPLFLNLLSLIAPTLWVLLAGAMGIGVGAYAPRLLRQLKDQNLKRPTKRKPANRKPSPVPSRKRPASR